MANTATFVVPEFHWLQVFCKIPNTEADELTQYCYLQEPPIIILK